MSKKPSDFTRFPVCSIFQKCEHEQIAVNIMVILKRTGNYFRELSWEEYESERKRDGNFSYGEKKYFDDVYRYCSSPDKAELFSAEWR